MPRPASPTDAPPASPKPRQRVRLALRIAGGVGLLAVVMWYADPRALARSLAGADPGWFILAVLVAIAANIVSAVRWSAIARALGMVAPIGRLVGMYARGITTNMLLPGATLSGDLLRSVQLAGLGNPLLRAALSVFLDRFSGLWVLCVMSLLAAAWLALSGLAQATALPAELAGYIVLLAAIAAAPLVPWPTGWLRVTRIAPLAVLAERIDGLRNRLAGERAALLRSVWLSVAVQILSAGALWICGRAVGLGLPFLSMLAAAAPIFIMAALPVGVAGFGTRELGAVLVLGFLGVPGDQATATALLYGLAAVVQGILAAPLFLTKP